ncbi:uncharacterized protein LOC134437519 [Engraulis encrasicolus]|uniref:uncharacterized protein LOC134437519 n=1 Tax=Engraulis encrasicolus TaxID=184585 RepID=UPI002FD523DC
MKMDPGCFSFVFSLRSFFTMLRKKIKQRRVRQTRPNYRVSKMLAIHKLNRRGRSILLGNMNIVQTGARASKRKTRRAHRVASGFKQRRKDLSRRTEAQKKLDILLRDRKGKKVLQSKPVGATSDQDGKANPIVAGIKPVTARSLACCPLRGKKAASEQWQDEALGGLPVVSDPSQPAALAFGFSRWSLRGLRRRPAEEILLAQPSQPTGDYTTTNTDMSVNINGGVGGLLPETIYWPAEQNQPCQPAGYYPTIYDLMTCSNGPPQPILAQESQPTDSGDQGTPPAKRAVGFSRTNRISLMRRSPADKILLACLKDPSVITMEMLFTCPTRWHTLVTYENGTLTTKRHN